MKQGQLYLIPNLLGGDDSKIIPSYVLPIVNTLRHFIVEREREARRFLIKLGISTAIDDLHFSVLDKHQSVDIGAFLNPIKQGHSIGLISDAGCPAVADPGALVVAEAHKRKIKVKPFVGPSSLLLALMASGLNGQQFAFHGYLPIEKDERIRTIKRLDKEVQKEGSTQLFIETPYRNDKLLADLLKYASPQSRLCIATDLTLPTEQILTSSIASWKKIEIPLHKRPAIFLLGK